MSRSFAHPVFRSPSATVHGRTTRKEWSCLSAFGFDWVCPQRVTVPDSATASGCVGGATFWPRATSFRSWLVAVWSTWVDRGPPASHSCIAPVCSGLLRALVGVGMPPPGNSKQLSPNAEARPHYTLTNSRIPTSLETVIPTSPRPRPSPSTPPS